MLDLGLPNLVINDDIKNISEKPDVIISRAVTSASDLIELTRHMITQNTTVILLKSKLQKEELKEVSKKWNYELQEFQNIYKTEGAILVIKNLSPKCKEASQ
jgi:16S rRNA G527 N7-methylase RsmG